MGTTATSWEGGPNPDRELAPATPMMRQYLEIKALHPDTILFFRLGDFYEMFFEDAIKGAELLQITLTSRSKGDERVPMCGVPYHSARRYIGKLIESGLKVAICDQMEEAGNGPGIVKREVTRIITPGTVLDEDALEPRANNFLASIVPSGGGFGAALLDPSTGELISFECESFFELKERLGLAEPRELLIPEEELPRPWVQELAASLNHRPSLTSMDRGAFEPARAAAFLKSHFKVASLEGFGLGQAPRAVAAAGGALRYLKNTQKTDARHVDRIHFSHREDVLVLDESTRANLEILRTVRDGSRAGSLLGVLDRTVTGMGARKFSRWLTAPLRSIPGINARLDAVEELSTHALWRSEMIELLKGVLDLERLCGRLSLGSGNARDLKGLANSLAVLPRLALALARCESPLIRMLLSPLTALKELEQVLRSALVDEPPISVKEGGLIRGGYNPELDELIQLTTSGKELLLRIEARERERTGIGSLKVRYNRVFGYYLEVTRSNLHLVPQDYIRKQTTVGAERYITPELKEYEEKVQSAEERRSALEYRLFEELRERVVGCAKEIRAAAEAVATADVLVCLAQCSSESGYQRPVVDESFAIDISAGRHPVVERMLSEERFVPNDLKLDREDTQILIITGPNMAGKSTAMRQVALIVLMAQAGSFVPAKSARIGLCDRIFTRIGASDNLSRGQSTFMVEMTETSNILHNATARSLVVLDEIGRGTSTFDGLSIAWAVAEHLHDRIGARTLFATHYHELTDLAREKPRVKNASIAVQEVQGKILFLRKLLSGGSSRSYGVEVARLAGLPREVVSRAKEILRNLESEELDEAGRPRLIHRPPRGENPQLPLFAGESTGTMAAYRAFAEELSKISVEALTPLEALNLVAKWKGSIS
jgi:DNA mismatch repair protein MutS